MDRIIETADGYDCIVDGTRYGTWRSRAEAGAGLKVEQGRLERRLRALGMWTDPAIPVAVYAADGAMVGA